jgi:hypothetical protein
MDWAAQTAPPGCPAVTRATVPCGRGGNTAWPGAVPLVVLALTMVASTSMAADSPRTPRAGRAYQTTVGDTPVDIHPFNRGDITSWDIGVATSTTADGFEILPFPSLYLFRRTDEQLLRAVVAGLANEVFLARRFGPSSGAEWLLSASMLALPVAEARRIDGVLRPQEEMLRGEFTASLGWGIRGQSAVAPGEQLDVDNMWEANVLVGPAFRWFLPGEHTTDDFILPSSHRALQVRATLRADGLTRNLLGGTHAGLAYGLRAMFGVRAGFAPWTHNPDPAPTWQTLNAWLIGAAPVGSLPEQHRLVYSLHGAIGHALDSSTAFRLGGGPPREEYFANESPLLSGAGIEEISTTRYAIGSLEYRHEPLFFFYWGPLATVALVDREHEEGGRLVRSDDLLLSGGLRVTTIFFFSTRIQLQYGSYFDVVQGPETLRHELTVHVSGRL